VTIHSKIHSVLRVLGEKPPLDKKFFNLLGFLLEKFENPPWKISVYAPALRSWVKRLKICQPSLNFILTNYNRAELSRARALFARKNERIQNTIIFNSSPFSHKMLKLIYLHIQLDVNIKIELKLLTYIYRYLCAHTIFIPRICVKFIKTKATLKKK